MASTVAQHWSTGLLGCLDIETESTFDPYNFTLVGAMCCPCCLYMHNRRVQLEAAPGENLYCVEHTCGADVGAHAFAQTIWCLTCPPINGGMNRGLIRRQAKIPGTVLHDVLMHTCLIPFALAQEARQLKMKGYSGEQILRLPLWRSMLVSIAPLHMLNKQLRDAASSGDLQLTDEVLRKGADPNVLDSNKISPLMIAAQAGHFEICQSLIEFGARVNAEDRVGITAMHRAAQMGHLELIVLLWDKGSHLEGVDSWGKRPEDYATGPARTTIRGILGKKIHLPKSLTMS